MATLTFDTLKIVKQLKGAGFEEDAAEAISNALVESQRAVTEDLATKYDLKSLESKIDKDLVEIKAEQKLIKWMLGFVLAGVAALILKSFFA